MKILVIGGTGVMGAPLVDILSSSPENIIDVISRHEKISNNDNVRYVVGDAFDFYSMEKILQMGGYDVAVDFMVYKVDEYQKFLNLFLNNVKQYILMSTACVYEEPSKGEKITELTPRLIDSYSEDKKHDLKSYHIMKSNLDNIVFESSLKNWTMIRPHITFNTDKYLMVLWHKEIWLYRALHDKEIVLPKDAMPCIQTVSYGGEVAYAISKLVGNKKAIGEVINVASDITLTWQEYVDMLSKAFQEVYGKTLKIKWVDTAQEISDAVSASNDFNMKDHIVRREFDIKKLREIGGQDIKFTNIEGNLKKSLAEFRKSGKNVMADGTINGYMDRLTHSKTPLSDVQGKRGKLLYLMYRYNLVIPWLANKLYNW